MFCLAMAIAMACDCALGWPSALFARIGHPVTWAGHLIGWLDRRLNRDQAAPALRRAAGIVCALLTVGTAAGLAAGVQTALPDGWVGMLLTGILAWPLVALRSMHDHVRAVVIPLRRGDLPGARVAVSMIVGRDPSRLDRAAVSRAALESLAENTSDGIVAPIFWGCILGLPGIAAYKAINTLDSMIGHRTLRHEAFGWCAARLDDVVNLLPARLTGVLFALTSARPGTALRVMWRNARHHRSPNAGWPEAAMAGALDLRLSGPRVYADRVSQEPWINAQARDPDENDLCAGLRLYRRAMLVLAGGLMLCAGLSA